jgi:hypothetical protein
MRRIGVSENMVNCIRAVYEGTKFFAKCAENEGTTFTLQTRGLRQGCSLSPDLLRIL